MLKDKILADSKRIKMKKIIKVLLFVTLLPTTLFVLAVLYQVYKFYMVGPTHHCIGGYESGCFNAYDDLKTEAERAEFLTSLKSLCLETPDHVCRFLGWLISTNPPKRERSLYDEAKAAESLPWLMRACTGGLDELGCAQLEESLKPVISNHPRAIAYYMHYKDSLKEGPDASDCSDCELHRQTLWEKQSAKDYQYQGPSYDTIHHIMKILCTSGPLDKRFARCLDYQKVTDTYGFKQDRSDELMLLGCNSVEPEVAYKHLECLGYVRGF